MDIRPASKEKFALDFQREFKRKKAEHESATSEPYGFRTAAKHIAAAHPTPAALKDKAQAARQVDSYRKQLQRCWWGRFMPTEQTRVIIAEELGCDPSVFGVEAKDKPTPVIGGGEMFADLRDALAELRKAERRVDRITSRLSKQLEGVAA